MSKGPLILFDPLNILICAIFGAAGLWCAKHLGLLPQPKTKKVAASGYPPPKQRW